MPCAFPRFQKSRRGGQRPPQQGTTGCSIKLSMTLTEHRSIATSTMEAQLTASGKQKLKITQPSPSLCHMDWDTQRAVFSETEDWSQKSLYYAKYTEEPLNSGTQQARCNTDLSPIGLLNLRPFDQWED